MGRRTAADGGNKGKMDSDPFLFCKIFGGGGADAGTDAGAALPLFLARTPRPLTKEIKMAMMIITGKKLETTKNDIVLSFALRCRLSRALYLCHYPGPSPSISTGIDTVNVVWRITAATILRCC